MQLAITISVSEGILDNLRKNGASKTAMVMNCRVLDFFQLDDEGKKILNTLRKKLNPENKIILFYVGSLGRERGLKDIINVFKDFDCENLLFILGGFGHMEKEVKECVKDVKNIEFIGAVQREDFPIYNHLADIMIVLFKSRRKMSIMSQRLSLGISWLKSLS